MQRATKQTKNSNKKQKRKIEKTCKNVLREEYKKKKTQDKKPKKQKTNSEMAKAKKPTQA